MTFINRSRCTRTACQPACTPQQCCPTCVQPQCNCTQCCPTVSQAEDCDLMRFNSGGQPLNAGNWLLYGNIVTGPTNEGLAEFLITRAGTLKNLIVQASVAPVAGSPDVITVRRNEVDTLLSVTISNPATAGSDLLDRVAVTAGDRISLQVKSISGASVNILASFEFCPSPCPPC